jgi:hypothetical protein
MNHFFNPFRSPSGSGFTEESAILEKAVFFTSDEAAVVPGHPETDESPKKRHIARLCEKKSPMGASPAKGRSGSGGFAAAPPFKKRGKEPGMGVSTRRIDRRLPWLRQR